MYFSAMKEKQQKAYRIQSYDEMLLNTVSSMFVYDFGVETDEEGKKLLSDPKAKLEYFSPLIDIYRILEGASAIAKNISTEKEIGTKYADDEYTICHVSFGGDPYPNGMGSIAICATDNGVVKEYEDWYNNPDVVVFFCNRLGAPDMNIGRFSDMFAELEVSMKCNIIFSRMYPIPIAKDRKIQTAIETAITNMLTGKIATILDENKLRAQIQEATKAAIECVQLTDEEKSKYIQYLAKMRDDLLRWFYSYYGMNSQGSSKLAQQTVDEVNQDSSASMIIPHDMFREAKKGCDMANTKFGWDIKVSFSECWMTRLANFDDEFKTTDEALEEGGEEPTGGNDSRDGDGDGLINEDGGDGNETE